MAVEMATVVRRQGIILGQDILLHTDQVGSLGRIVTQYMAVTMIVTVGMFYPCFAFTTAAYSTHQITSSSFRRNSSPCSTIIAKPPHEGQASPRRFMVTPCEQ